jgi:two-component system chemotaxis response regulator CheB
VGEDTLTDRQPTAGPATRLIVIGASAGGLPPLRAVISELPADLPAAVLVVVHVSSTGTSVLPQILSRASALDVQAAVDGLELRPGLVAVAPPDRHMIVVDGRVALRRSARENGHRPAIDPLFRTAAAVYGEACCALVLSGTRDDGTAGMAEVKRRGGVAVVQDPHEALYGDMPANAIAGTEVDGVLPVADIAAELVRLAHGEGTLPRRPASLLSSDVRDGEVLTITCPECGGVMTERYQGAVLQFACHVGHSYSPSSMLAAHAEDVERAMWVAARTLEDRATLLRRMAQRARSIESERSARQFERNADEATEQADAIRLAIVALDDAALAIPDTDDQEMTA